MCSKSESGFALITCMLISLILITIGMSFTYRARQKLQVAQQLKDRLQADLRTWSAYQQVLYELSTSVFFQSGAQTGPLDKNYSAAHPALEALAPGGVVSSGPTSSGLTPSGLGLVQPNKPPVNFYGEKVAWGEGVTVALKDTAGMVPLIGGDESLLRKLLEYHKVAPAQIERILDSLEDWQDSDELKRLNGAESWQYKMMNAGYMPRNSFCQTLDELLLVWGMTPEILNALRPDLTFFGGATFNLMNASPTLLRAFYYPNTALADTLLEARSKGILTDDFSGTAAASGVEGDFSSWPSTRTQISVEGKYGGSTSRMTVLCNRTETLKAPFQVELWKK